MKCRPEVVGGYYNEFPQTSPWSRFVEELVVAKQANVVLDCAVVVVHFCNIICWQKYNLPIYSQKWLDLLSRETSALFCGIFLLEVSPF